MTKALDYIRREFSPEETRNLAIHRLLINCYLYRWFEFQPVDVDAVVLVRDILHFVEFKQKYPYRLREGTPVGLFVGLDESHQGLLVWLEEGRTPYVHVVLSNPLWSRFKNESPLHLLAGGSVTLPHATWMGGRLTRASFDPRAARIVHGADAGRRSGRRSLGAINVERFRELGTGSTPSLLSKLLFDGDDTLRIVLTSALQERNKQGEKDYLAWNAGR